MKKTWIALAVAGAFVGAAQAQSSVTLYGIVDVNLQYFDPKFGGIDSTTRIDSGHQSGSRWGMRGSEDLGGNLKGIFTLEGGYNPDTGTLGQGGRLFGRQAWAGLQGGFGSIVLGRLASLGSGTGSWDMFGQIDPFLTGFGGLNLAFSVASAQRYDNGILWKSPNWGGLTVGVEHSRNVGAAEVPGNQNNQYLTGGAISFGAGPFYGAVTYTTTNNPAPGGKDQKNLQAGGTFDLGVVKLHAAYAKEDDNFAFNVAGINDGADASAYMGGVSVKLGAGMLMASYNGYNGKANGTSGQERDFNQYGLAYSHPLSRRTNLYGSYGYRKGKKALDVSGGLAVQNWNFSQYTFGVRHLF